MKSLSLLAGRTVIASILCCSPMAHWVDLKYSQVLLALLGTVFIFDCLVAIIGFLYIYCNNFSTCDFDSNSSL